MSFRLETSRMASRNVGCFARSGHEISVFQAAYYNLHVWQNRIKKYRILFEIYIYISSRFFLNQPNEICSHLSEKLSKRRFLKADKLQNHTNEGKGKEKK